MKKSLATKIAQMNKNTNTNESVNWNAKYYREKAASFFNSASFCEASQPIAIEMGKREKKALVKAGLEAAMKVRHNRPLVQKAAVNSIVMVGGVPHKMRDGKLVPMIPAAKSKKWDVIEA